MAHDPTSQSIRFALFAVLGFTALALIAGLLIPFDVKQGASVRNLSGSVDILIPGEAPIVLTADSQLTLKPGQSVRVQPDSEAYITFKINKGRALLSGPAMLTLVQSNRRATSLGHTLDSVNQDYVLTLEQTQGSVRYIFANTTPPVEEIAITIQLPGGNYTPTTPCWTITIDTNGQSTAESIDCPT